MLFYIGNSKFGCIYISSATIVWSFCTDVDHNNDDPDLCSQMASLSHNISNKYQIAVCPSIIATICLCRAINLFT